MSDPQRRAAEGASTASVQALAIGDYNQALARAESGLLAAPDDPWLLYNRGTALAGLGRLDESLAVLRKAEARFAPQNMHGRPEAPRERVERVAPPSYLPTAPRRVDDDDDDAPLPPALPPPFRR